MAQDKNNKYIKEDKNNDSKKKYKNPVSSKAGKIIIVTLALAMALSGIISLIIMACMGKL
ncbi:hypothetical protein EI71_00809 [Anaeroplasma bactoclasticum]|jgi:hypothetical protein|uniref:DUF4044 domain-containing protein n=1 Tax=Anaeroplasma bactoclasticum TaxID=2088 RepID=A0A397RUG8_9MOLU|nr:hypothetical protein [Anaeroplasma bactoclasticum]RIA77833.1 hypothetical protein EI71_00809 [Anaeroplasma bactoclasticum]